VRLSQIRFRRGNALLDGETLRALRHANAWSRSARARSRWHGRLPRQTSQRLIDVERRAGCDVADFWEPMHSRRCRSIRWWASFACTMPALRLRGRRRARCWKRARAKCRSSSITEEPKQFVA
jgi:hypothetical protein